MDMNKDDLKCCGNCKLAFTKECPYARPYTIAEEDVKIYPNSYEFCESWEWDRRMQVNRFTE